MFSKGQRVTLTGLTQKPELNGQQGVVQDVDSETGRYVVLVNSKAISVKTENLQLSDPNPSTSEATQPSSAVDVEEPEMLPTATALTSIFLKVPEGLKPGSFA